jgi:hypothetical protein
MWLCFFFIEMRLNLLKKKKKKFKLFTMNLYKLYCKKCMAYTSVDRRARELCGLDAAVR